MVWWVNETGDGGRGTSAVHRVRWKSMWGSLGIAERVTMRNNSFTNRIVVGSDRIVVLTTGT